jgi:hypothetical protein
VVSAISNQPDEEVKVKVGRKVLPGRLKLCGSIDEVRTKEDEICEWLENQTGTFKDTTNFPPKAKKTQSKKIPKKTNKRNNGENNENIHAKKQKQKRKGKETVGNILLVAPFDDVTEATPPVTKRVSQDFTASPNSTERGVTEATPPVTKRVSQDFTASPNSTERGVTEATPPVTKRVSQDFTASPNSTECGVTEASLPVAERVSQDVTASPMSIGSYSDHSNMAISISDSSSEWEAIELDLNIQKIQGQVELLLAKHADLVQRNEVLEHQVAGLLQHNRALEHRVAELEQSKVNNHDSDSFSWRAHVGAHNDTYSMYSLSQNKCSIQA